MLTAPIGAAKSNMATLMPHPCLMLHLKFKFIIVIFMMIFLVSALYIHIIHSSDLDQRYVVPHVVSVYSEQEAIWSLAELLEGSCSINSQTDQYVYSKM